MKYCFTFLLACLSLVTASMAQGLEGSWMGTLDAGVKLRLVFNLERNIDGNLAGTMDSPDQGARGIPFSTVRVTSDSLTTTIVAINATYQGIIKNDSTIEGHWMQGGGKFPLTLTRSTPLKEPARPQAVKPPFPYQTEEIAIDNPDRTVHLAGTFSYPSTGGPFPVAVLITGSGQQDRDETIFSHKPFAVIADHFTRNGMAVLRLDDRGAGKSKGPLEHATSADFADDIELAINHISQHPQVNKKKIGLVGHSEGGLIAAMIAARNKHIDFLILLAAPGTTGKVLLADQNEALLKASGIPAEATNSYGKLFSSIIDAALNHKDSVKALRAAENALMLYQDTTPTALQAAVGLASPEAGKMIKTMLNEFRKPWMKYFLQSDPAALLAKTRAKVLALNGEKDLQVLAQPNLDGIKEALAKSKSPVYHTMELKGLNHLFQTCNTCLPTEYGVLEETFSPVALQAMTDWLNENVID